MNRAKIKPDKTQLRTYTPPDLDDKWFQLFTYGRYRAPHRAQLSDFQQRIYNLKRLGMEAAQIAERLGLRRQTIDSHLQGIKNKGWE